jgi:hypothetical protein
MNGNTSKTANKTWTIACEIVQNEKAAGKPNLARDVFGPSTLDAKATSKKEIISLEISEMFCRIERRKDSKMTESAAYNWAKVFIDSRRKTT